MKLGKNTKHKSIEKPKTLNLQDATVQQKIAPPIAKLVPPVLFPHTQMHLSVTFDKAQEDLAVDSCEFMPAESIIPAVHPLLIEESATNIVIPEVNSECKTDLKKDANLQENKSISEQTDDREQNSMPSKAPVKKGAVNFL